MIHRTLACTALLALAACAEAPTTETDLATAFCDLLANGPTESVTASADETGAPEVAFEDARVEITMASGSDGHVGTVTYTPDEAGSFAMGLSDDVDFEVRDAAGTLIAFDAEVAGGCDAMAVRYTVALDIQSYTLTFGPGSDVPEVMYFVAEESDDDL